MSKKTNLDEQTTQPDELQATPDQTTPAESQPTTDPPVSLAPAADPEKEARRAAFQAELDAFAARGALTSKDAGRIHELRRLLAELG